MVVNVVAYSTSNDGKALGSCTPVTVTAGGSGDGPVRVGIFAKDQSRRNIAELQSRGIDATPSAQMHELARIQARRGLDEKFQGLVQFWAADMQAQVLRRIAGPARNP